MELIQADKPRGVYSNSKSTGHSRRKCNCPCKSLFRVNDRSIYLGAFATEKEAMQAYDNAAYYSRLTRNKHRATLNFPGDYAEDNLFMPPPWPRTKHILAELKTNPPPLSLTAQRTASSVATVLAKRHAAIMGCPLDTFDLAGDLAVAGELIDREI